MRPAIWLTCRVGTAAHDDRSMSPLSVHSDRRRPRVRGRLPAHPIGSCPRGRRTSACAATRPATAASARSVPGVRARNSLHCDISAVTASCLEQPLQDMQGARVKLADQRAPCASCGIECGNGPQQAALRFERCRINRCRDGSDSENPLRWRRLAWAGSRHEFDRSAVD